MAVDVTVEQRIERSRDEVARFEIEEYDPPRRLAMRSVKAPFPMTVVYEFEEDERRWGGVEAEI